MNLLKRHWLIASLIVVALAVFAAFQFKGTEQPKYFTAKVDRGDIRQVVEATGTINAVTTVQVGSQVSGTISRLNADFNSRVKKGQVVAQIDPSLFQGSLLQAKADLANAKANVVASQANLEKAQASALQARADYERTAGLAKEGVMSQQQLDLAKATADSDDAAVAAAEATITQALAQVQLKQAAVTVAQTNLDYTTIHAPIDGTVIARSVDVGQTVAASLQAPTLFTIAQDLTKMQVYASTDESDVGVIRTGQIVTFKVDAFPKDTFTGRVSQVRLNATTVQNVVTYNTIIDFDNPDLKLFPGHDRLHHDSGSDRAKYIARAQRGAALQTGHDRGPVARAVQAIRISHRPGRGNAIRRRSGGGRRWGRSKPQRARGKAPTAADAAAAQPHTPRVDVAVVWKLRPDKTLEPVRIRTGITDHTVTEVAQVLNGQLNEGDELITGGVAGSSAATRAPGLGGTTPRVR